LGVVIPRIALWLRGEVERAGETIKDARQRAIECAHAPVLAQHYDFEGMFEALRGDAEAVRRAAELCIEVSGEHDIAVFLSERIGYLGWARAKLGEREAGIAQLNECISAHVEQGNRAFIPFFQGLLAEIEGQEGNHQTGLSRIDAAIALANEMGAHWCDAFLLHIRGKILLHCNPENTAPAEEAFRSAIDIAQGQKTKSLELRAALALAKLYQASNRAADAQAVLGPAIEGFSSTSEFPEIQEARTLLRASA
jgi:predicted ATPase